MNMNWILECFPKYKILIEYDNIDDKGNKKEIHGLKERENTIEQNRCAMACQGCGAVLFLLKKQWNYFP